MSPRRWAVKVKRVVEGAHRRRRRRQGSGSWVRRGALVDALVTVPGFVLAPWSTL